MGREIIFIWGEALLLVVMGERGNGRWISDIGILGEGFVCITRIEENYRQRFEELKSRKGSLGSC